MKLIRRAALLIAMAAACPVFAQDTPSADGARVYFATLEDGAVVKSPVTIVFGLAGMGVAPAGVEQENTGHHHLLIDRPAFGQGEGGAEEFTLAVPKDDHNRHFGGGQTEVTLELAPGPHTLQLVLGDYGHVPHNPAVVSERITITVE